MGDERWRIDMVSHSGSVAKIYGSLTGCGRCGNGWMAIAVDKTVPKWSAISVKTNLGTAFAEALSRWRVLTSYLRPRAQDDRAYIVQRDTNIASAASQMIWSHRSGASVSPNSLKLRAITIE